MNYIRHCGSGPSREGLSESIFSILLNESIIPSKAQKDAKCLR